MLLEKEKKDSEDERQIRVGNGYKRETEKGELIKSLVFLVGGIVCIVLGLALLLGYLNADTIDHSGNLVTSSERGWGFLVLGLILILPGFYGLFSSVF